MIPRAAVAPILRLLNLFALVYALLFASNIPRALLPPTATPDELLGLVTGFSFARLLLIAGGLLLIYRQRRAYRDEWSIYLNRIAARRSSPQNEAMTDRVWSISVFLLLGSLAMVVLAGALRSRWGLTFSPLRTLLPLGEIMLGWLVFALIFIGWGQFPLRLLSRADTKFADVFLSFWLGWALVIVFLLNWHLFAPITGLTTLIAAAVGVVGYAINHRRLAAWWRDASTVPGRFWWFVLLLAVCLAGSAIVPPRSADAGLYDYSAIRWLETYAAVPGLANLHTRLGFNNSSYLYFAFLDQGLWRGKAHHLVNTLLNFMLLTQIMLSLFHRAGGDDRNAPPRLFLAMISFPALIWATHKYVTSPNSDNILYPLGAFLFAAWLAYREQKNESGGASPLLLTTIVLTAAVGITVKLSFAVLGAAVAVFAFLRFAAALSADRKRLARRTALLTLLAAVVFIPWMIRGVVLSGYAVYPISFTRLDMPWSVPAATAVQEIQSTRAWARDSTLPKQEALSGWSWLRGWARHMSRECFDIVLPFAIIVAALIALLFGGLLRSGHGPPWREMIVLIPPGLAVLFWFFTAPATQFEGASLWILAVSMLLPAIRLLGGLTAQNALRSIVLVAVVLVAVIRMILPGPSLEYGVIPQAQVTTYHTERGLGLSVPADELCWSAPLPCTPYPNGRLQLRRPGDLSAGFVLADENK